VLVRGGPAPRGGTSEREYSGKDPDGVPRWRPPAPFRARRPAPSVVGLGATPDATARHVSLRDGLLRVAIGLIGSHYATARHVSLRDGLLRVAIGLIGSHYATARHVSLLDGLLRPLSASTRRPTRLPGTFPCSTACSELPSASSCRTARLPGTFPCATTASAPSPASSGPATRLPVAFRRPRPPTESSATPARRATEPHRSHPC
jgi:hypothetical protein